MEPQLESQRRTFLVNPRENGGWDSEAGSCFPQKLQVEERRNKASHPLQMEKPRPEELRDLQRPPSNSVTALKWCHGRPIPDVPPSLRTPQSPLSLRSDSEPPGLSQTDQG